MERFLTNDRLISSHRNRLDLIEFPKDKLKMPYLDAKFNQFLLNLDSRDENLIQKTLTEIFNQLQNGEEVFKYSVQNPELMQKVFQFLFYFDENKNNDIDKVIRTLSSQCFKQFCIILNVKELLHEGDYLKSIHKTFDDDFESVKLNVYQGLIFYSQSRCGIDHLVQNGILQKIIKKVTEEKSTSVVKLILTLLNECLNAQTAPEIALQSGIIMNLKLHLNSNDFEVREKVILNYGSISLCEEGKRATVEEGSLVLSVLNLLKLYQSSLSILVASTRFLMSASILKRGKVEIYENQGLESCIKLLDHVQDEQMILNNLQLIANVAEEPRARKKLNENYLNNITKFLTHNNELIKSQAVITRDIIVWKP